MPFAFDENASDNKPILATFDIPIKGKKQAVKVAFWQSAPYNDAKTNGFGKATEEGSIADRRSKIFDFVRIALQQNCDFVVLPNKNLLTNSSVSINDILYLHDTNSNYSFVNLPASPKYIIYRKTYEFASSTENLLGLHLRFTVKSSGSSVRDTLVTSNPDLSLVCMTLKGTSADISSQLASFNASEEPTIFVGQTDKAFYYAPEVKGIYGSHRPMLATKLPKPDHIPDEQLPEVEAYGARSFFYSRDNNGVFSAPLIHFLNSGQDFSPEPHQYTRYAGTKPGILQEPLCVTPEEQQYFYGRLNRVARKILQEYGLEVVTLVDPNLNNLTFGLRLQSSEGVKQAFAKLDKFLKKGDRSETLDTHALAWRELARSELFVEIEDILTPKFGQYAGKFSYPDTRDLIYVVIAILTQVRIYLATEVLYRADWNKGWITSSSKPETTSVYNNTLSCEEKNRIFNAHAEGTGARSKRIYNIVNSGCHGRIGSIPNWQAKGFEDEIDHQKGFSLGIPALDFRDPSARSIIGNLHLFSSELDVIQSIMQPDPAVSPAASPGVPRTPAHSVDDASWSSIVSPFV